ncbi:hypothetical protein EHM69_05705 [candidate division KSB1 bacterium]|nr:MAG: hypothetical protein EHM69_05705 [candidate division KSB1 bacterium]
MESRIVGKEAKSASGSRSKKEKPAQPRPGRMNGPEKYTKATVPLFDRQIAALDEIRAAIKRRTGASVMRAEIIRAALDAILEAKIDLTGVRPEPEFKNGDLKKLIIARFKR